MLPFFIVCFKCFEPFCYLYSDSESRLYELRNRVFCALHTLVGRRCRRRNIEIYINVALSAIDRLIVANAYLL